MRIAIDKKIVEGLGEIWAFDEEIGRMCCRALNEHRLDAFDNIEIATVLPDRRIGPEEARRIGRHLLLNAHSNEGFLLGREISRAVQCR